MHKYSTAEHKGRVTNNPGLPSHVTVRVGSCACVPACVSVRADPVLGATNVFLVDFHLTDIYKLPFVAVRHITWIPC